VHKCLLLVHPTKTWSGREKWEVVERGRTGNQEKNAFKYLIGKYYRMINKIMAGLQIQTKIKEKMVLDGSMMVGYSPIPHKNVSNALRLVIPAYPKKTHEHMDIVLDKIVQFGCAL